MRADVHFTHIGYDPLVFDPQNIASESTAAGDRVKAKIDRPAPGVKQRSGLKYLEAERCLRNCLYVVTDAARLIRYNTKPDIKGAVALMQG